MVKGYICRRKSQRIPFQSEISIQFNATEKGTITATTANISADGMRFYLPKGQLRLAPEDRVELIFNLTPKKTLEIKSEICYFTCDIDDNRQPVVYYGVKFINITHADWEHINAFCQARLEDSEASPESENETENEPENKTETEVASPQEPSGATIAEIMASSDLIDKNNPYRILSQDLIDQIFNLVQDKKPKKAKSQPPVETIKPDVKIQPDQKATKPEPKAKESDSVKYSDLNLNLKPLGEEIKESPLNYEISFETFPVPSKNNNSEISGNFLPTSESSLIELVFNPTPDQKATAPEPAAENSRPPIMNPKPIPAEIPKTDPTVKEPQPAKGDGSKITEIQPSPAMNHPAEPTRQTVGTDKTDKNENPFNSIGQKLSSVIMDQRMIDQIVQNLVPKQSTERQIKIAKNIPSTVDNTPNRNHVISLQAILTFNTAKKFVCEVERIYFGGIIVRLPEEIPGNTFVTIDINGKTASLSGVSGICASCEYDRAATNYQVEFFFKGLNTSHMEILKKIILTIQTG